MIYLSSKTIDEFTIFAHTNNMITSELLIYIQECQKQGYHFSSIKDTLIAYGWEETDVVQAYLHISNIRTNQAKKKFSKNAIRHSAKYIGTIVLSVLISLIGAGTYITLHAQTQPIINPVITLNETPTTTTPPMQLSQTVPLTPSPSTAVLGASTQSAQTTLKKSSYSIAIIGDSMVDTMGEKMELLQNSLKNLYPTTTFTLYNYGIGAQNVEQGLARFSTAFNYKTRHYPALSELHPDIIIVASFAYNPFSPFSKDKHYTLLSQLVNQAKSAANKVYVLAEIAPLQYDFAKGPSGIADWTDNYRAEHAQEIVDLLHNAIAVAKAENVGLIDAFEQTETYGEFGDAKYTNPDDGIHPSTYGQTITANMIAHTISFK